MIWYLLYPFRGTTEPPRLSPSHPIRRAFQAHGTATAQHWLLSILLTILVSVLLCYPAIFQTDSPAAAGLRNLPKHVWTSTTEVQGERPADVEVRQVWVHGDYMKAIDQRVLRQALIVQNRLIGNGFGGHDTTNGHIEHHDMITSDGEGCSVRDTGAHWYFHSPLMYWDCSLSALEHDDDLLHTINSQAKERTAWNLTLRPSTVFAGKAFANKRLRAADALVMSLFDQTNSSLGHEWQSRSIKLAQELGPAWSLFPKDGYITKSRLYEFRFKPMTLNDDLFLAASYLFTAAYVVWRMMQLRAVKSWFGLLITICVKMTVCVIGSFTVCSYLGINLARIPRPWFPGVVFCFGLGNIFRLINVVLETPPEMPPVQRIGTAIGEVGHLSLAVAGQNLALIYLCSRLVTPWVADFCVFAAVTLVLDFVFHLTFFLAVLSVDVQRMELQDSLERADVGQRSKTRRLDRQSWLAALHQGDLPFSTRFAGSAAIFCIILALNWHFFDSPGRQLNPRTILDRLRARTSTPAASSSWSPSPINQARTPADWLRILDHNTAKELFDLLKPDAHSFIAHVYDPLLVVMSGAEGRDTTQQTASILRSMRKFAKDHAFPAALIVVSLIAGVTLLMNYLLWSGIPKSSEHDEDDEALFLVKTLPAPQALDIVRLASSPKGHLVSISLDRTISIWLHGRRGYLSTTLQTASTKQRLWPIIGCAIDDGGEILALCTDSGQIGFWGLTATCFLRFSIIDTRGQLPLVFSFVVFQNTEHDGLSIVMVTPDGYLSAVEVHTGAHHTKRICSGSILAATLYTCVKTGTNLIFVTKEGEVHILSLKAASEWTTEIVAGLNPRPPPGSNSDVSKIKGIHGTPSLGLIFAIRGAEADIIDFNSRALVYTLQLGYVEPQSFRVMHTTRRSCPCGAPAVHSFTIAYTEQNTDHMIMQTFTLDDNSSSQICLSKSSENDSQNCRRLDSAKEAVHCVDPAGVWESTDALSIVGIRKCFQPPSPSSSASGFDSGYFAAESATNSSALKLRASRGRKQKGRFMSLDSTFSVQQSPASPIDADRWETWTLTSTGDLSLRPLVSDMDDDDVDALSMEDQLFVAAPGPITRSGKRSVAVGFGNTVKIISLGRESFNGMTSNEEGTLDMSIGSYKWRARRGTGRKAQ